MPRTKPPFRADHVGSLLRPAALKAARGKRERGEITAAELAAVEDRVIETVIRKQEDIGLRWVTDGEFRRALSNYDFLGKPAGVEAYLGERKIKFSRARRRPADAAAHLCPHDQCGDLRRPRGHDQGDAPVPRNFQSSFVASGGYEPVAEILFNEIDIDAYFMEYDSDRAGGFEPLRFVPKGKMVVLGLVTSKSGTLEEKDPLKRRIEEAAKFVDLDQLCLSPQCGFASSEEGNILAEDEQWAKLRRIVEVADEVWR